MNNTATYPDSPGFKANGTSREAAETMKGRAALLRERVLALLKSAPLTADECAILLKETVLATRPRLTELKRTGLIEDAGERRRNVSGATATVWKATHRRSPGS